VGNFICIIDADQPSFFACSCKHELFPVAIFLLGANMQKKMGALIILACLVATPFLTQVVHATPIFNWTNLDLNLHRSQ
jgi:hypothetical protein